MVVLLSPFVCAPQSLPSLHCALGQARIAFKLVWCPPAFERFVLIDDAGALLNTGTPSAGDKALPRLSERRRNFEAVMGSKYAVKAEEEGARS